MKRKENMKTVRAGRERCDNFVFEVTEGYTMHERSEPRLERVAEAMNEGEAEPGEKALWPTSSALSPPCTSENFTYKGREVAIAVCKKMMEVKIPALIPSPSLQAEGSEGLTFTPKTSTPVQADTEVSQSTPPKAEPSLPAVDRPKMPSTPKDHEASEVEEDKRQVVEAPLLPPAAALACASNAHRRSLPPPSLICIFMADMKQLVTLCLRADGRD